MEILLQDVRPKQVERSTALLAAARRKERVEFLDHVTAYKKLILDQLRHPEPHAVTSEHITWGLSRSLAGIGDTRPAEVTVVALGREVAIVCLPGELFIELVITRAMLRPPRHARPGTATGHGAAAGVHAHQHLETEDGAVHGDVVRRDGGETYATSTPLTFLLDGSSPATPSAWKPNEISAPGAIVPFQSAFLMT